MIRRYSWKHILIYIVPKAIRTLGFIKKATADFLSPGSILFLYKSLVTLILTYGLVIWPPHLDYLINNIVSVHHNILRYLCYKSSEPMNNRDYNYKPSMRKFNILRNALRNYSNCIELDSFFTERTLFYSLRKYNTIITHSCRDYFLYYLAGPRLRRQSNIILLDINLISLLLN